MTPAAVSVRNLVTKMDAELRRVLGGPATLRLTLPDDLWSAWIDAGPLARALTNLATNAFEAMTVGGSQKGGCLTIEARNRVLDQDHADGQAEVAAGRYVLLVVTDTGAGMPRDVLERAFEPFFTTKPDGGGTGLGLSLVFGFIRQSGGHISIDSQLDGGTTVRIYLPAAADQAGASENGASSEDATGGVRAPHGALSRPAGTPPPRTGGTQPRDRENSPPGASVANADAPVLWRNAEAALFATVQAEAGDIRYRLIIEPLPRRDGWDWTVSAAPATPANASLPWARFIGRERDGGRRGRHPGLAFDPMGFDPGARHPGGCDPGRRGGRGCGPGLVRIARRARTSGRDAVIGRVNPTARINESGNESGIVTSFRYLT